jgi:uncharacterized membrane protein YbhN (UPF0104 family)
MLLSVSCLALAGVATIALWPLLGPAVAHAAEGLGRIRPELLILSGALFAAAPVFCGLAWRDAILRAGGEVGRVDACARYGVGSFVNSLAPAHLGDLVRAVLLLEKLPAGGRRRIVPWFGVIQGARFAALVALAIAAALPGLLILIPLVLPLALVVAALSRGTAQLVCLAFLSPMAKAAAIAVVLAGLDVGSPLDALAVVPALELAALLPLTPGNVGVAGAAASGALFAQGLPMSTAVQAGLALHAVETAAGLTYGTASALAWLAGLGPGRSLARGSRAVRSAAARAATIGRVQPEATKP